MDTLIVSNKYAAYIVSFLSFDSSPSLELLAPDTFPAALTVACLKLIPSNVRKISINLVGFDDELLEALTDSPCAPTLEKIKFQTHTVLTDTSARCWAKFTNLLCLHLEAQRIRQKTLGALSKMRRLQKLALRIGFDTTNSSLYSGLLSGENLPEIRDVRLSGADRDSTSFFTSLIQTLRSRPSATQIENLALGGKLSMTAAEARELQALCPNLHLASAVRGMMWKNELFDEFFRDASTIKELNFDDLVKMYSEVDPTKIAAAFPRLTSVRLSYPFTLLNGNYSGFSHLRRLDLFSEGYLPLTDLPPLLETLDYTSSLHHSGTPELDAEATHALRMLYNNIPVQAPLLSHLYIGHPCFPEPAQVIHLVESLPLLTSLTLDHPCENADPHLIEKVFVLSHPKLNTLPVVNVPRLKVNLGYCPSVRKLTIDPLDLKGEVPLCEIYPNATDFVSSNYYPRHPIVFTPITDTLGCFAERVHSLRLAYPLPRADFEFAIANFRRMTSLEIDFHCSASISGDDIREILTCLPLLLSLHIDTIQQIENLDFVRHPQLASLALQSDRAVVPSVVPPVAFRCSHERLPSLRYCTLGGHNMEIIVEDAPYLCSLQVSGATSVNMSVKNCAALSSVSLSRCRAQRLSILPTTEGSSSLRSLTCVDADVTALANDLGALEIPIATDSFQFNSIRARGGPELRAKYPILVRGTTMLFDKPKMDVARELALEEAEHTNLSEI